METDREWWTFLAPSRGGVDPLGGQPGRPGLWKITSRRDRKKPVWEFHLPLAALELEDASDRDDSVSRRFRAVIHWVEASAGGAEVKGWAPPPRDRLDSWVRPGSLTVQSGPFLAQGEVVHESNRLVLRFPLLQKPVGGLSSSRRAWIREAVMEAQRRWRMVRLGWGDAGGGSPALGAEVDLSGAPHELLERLLPIGLDALRWVVSWLIWPVRFLADPGVACDAWEISPERAWPAERS